MKVCELIEQIDKLHPNSYDPEDKISWLYRLDKTIYLTQFKSHETLCDIIFPDGYTDESELLVEEPFTELYFDYLERIFMRNQRDFAQMSNSSILFNQSFKEYSDYLNRTYMPIPKVKIFNFTRSDIEDVLSTD